MSNNRPQDVADILEALDEPTPNEVYEATREYDTNYIAAAAASKAHAGGGGGGSQPPTPFVQQDDPGAVGAGAIWVVEFDEIVNIRNAVDDAWVQVYPPADPPSDPDLAAVLSEGGDGGGNSITNVGDLELTGDAQIGGALNHDGTTAGFYGATPVPQQSYDSGASDSTRIGALESILLSLGIAVDTAP